MPDGSDAARVLIIEDDPLDREIYKRALLSAAGRFTFAEETTGARGLARIPEFRPHCILLDFALPDMNGLEMLERLAAAASPWPAPVIVLTSAKDERLAVASMKGGAMDYVPKGQFAAETIAHTVDNAISKFRLEREIAEQQRRYQSLIEAMPQVVWTAEPNGKLDFVNARWFEALGVDLASFNESGWATLIHPEERDRCLQAWESGLQLGAVFQMEHRLRKLPGDTYRWYLTRAVPMHSGSGAVCRWFGTSTDIEDQKRSEMAVFARQKLESIGLLAGGIAHDFNNLLVGVLGGASILAETLPPSDPQQAIVAGIRDAGERAAHLTRQMLAYAGKGRFLIRRVDVNELARSTSDVVRASIPKNVTVTLNLHPDLLLVEADATQLQQVIMNLLINAGEAVDHQARGAVEVKTELVNIEERKSGGPLVSGSLAPGTYVVLEVRDNGGGMSDETRNRIFEPFFTTKFTGRGLGLSAVEGILRVHNGAMELQSASGAGSTFRVYLPATKVLESSHEQSVTVPVAGTGGTVLVVDDEEIVRSTARLSLENSGFSVRLAGGGEDAMRILRDCGADPISLVLLDLSMPGVSGKELLRQMRDAGIGTPVLICSGYSEAEIEKEFTGMDISGFVEKPFTLRQLADRVSRVLQPADGRPA